MSALIGKTGIVVRNIERADAASIEELATLGVATVHEAQGRKGLLRRDIRPIQQDFGIAGSAVTVLVAPGDNWMFHVAVELCQPGDILVVAPSSPAPTAISATCWPPRSRPAAWPRWSSTQACATPAPCARWASRYGRGQSAPRAR